MNENLLKNLCKIKGGSGFPEIYQGSDSGDYPFIKVSDMNLGGNLRFIYIANNYVNKSLVAILGLTVFPPETVVFAKVGAAIFLNKRRILTQETIIDNNMMGLIPIDIDPIFLFYFMQSIDFEQYVQTGALPSLNQEIVGEIKVPKYSVTEQHKIAKILTTVDNLIEKTQTLIDKYQSIKQGMMHDLFTRGVDENGRLRPTFKEAPQLYKESELGWIPKEWEAVELSKVVPKAEYGISVSLDDAEGVPVFRMNNLKDGEFVISDIKKSNHIDARKLLLEPLDVLFNRTNSIEHVGRTSVWREQLPQASFASYLVRLIPDRSKLNPEYLNYWLNLPQTQITIRQFATPGVQQVNINPTNLRRTIICIPLSLSEQSKIVEIVTKHRELINAESRYLYKLKEKKQGLMQDLLTGEVRVKVDEIKEETVS
jgi:type I restriction enzyme, S subunit